MKTKEEILGELWDSFNKRRDIRLSLGSDFVNEVIHKAMEEYANQSEKARAESALSGFYSMFKGGFKLRVKAMPNIERGEGLLLVHPDNMPKNNEP